MDSAAGNFMLYRFGEDLDPDVLGKAAKALQTCDLFMTVGTSLWCTQRPALQLRHLSNQTVVYIMHSGRYIEQSTIHLGGTLTPVLPSRSCEQACIKRAGRCKRRAFGRSQPGYQQSN
ncbi:TPA: hypothetical protein ACH3X1_002061 [Trebouxia sp. C0004]